MNNDLIFRKGTAEDLSLFSAFFKASMPILFPEYSPESIKCITDIDFNFHVLTEGLNDGRVYFAFKANKIIGYVFVEKLCGGVSNCDWLAVDKQYQKQGIGKELLSLWEKDVLTKSVHALQLWASKNNREFYKKCGFSSGGLFPKAWYGEDSYLFYKLLG